MMWTILTAINIAGAGTAISFIINLLHNYVINVRMKTFALFRMAGLAAFIFLQFYSFTDQRGDWLIKLGLFYWWLSDIYWSVAIRTSSLKKYGESKIKKLSL